MSSYNYCAFAANIYLSPYIIIITAHYAPKVAHCLGRKFLYSRHQYQIPKKSETSTFNSGHGIHSAKVLSSLQKETELETRSTPLCFGYNKFIDGEQPSFAKF
uniref:Uncharacterized protein n=1 Tax=Glossina pallidipes TaxID=7398 RepID=A0A1B0AG53_GLOPL